MASTARIDELKKKFDENPRRYFAPLANEFRKAGDAEQAVMICEEFLPQQPGHMSGHIVYGQALYDLGRLDDARTVFETALTLDPENLIALRYLGDIAQSHGEPESARHWYQRVLEADPRNEEVQALIVSLDAGAAAAPPAAGSAPPAAAIEQSMMVDLAPADGTPAAPPPLPPEPQPGSHHGSLHESKHESLLELDVVEEHALGTAPVAEPPATAEAASRTEGFEPMEFTAPPSSTGGALDDQVEHGEFSAPPSSVAPLDGLEETALGAFEARPAAGAPTSPSSLPDLEPLPESGASAASDQPPVDIPPEVIAAEAELIDAREAIELPPPPSAPPPPPRVTPSQPFVTETMAELYMKQGFREQALDVYKLLLAASPDNPRLRDRVAELQPRDDADAGPNVRDFFARLAARRPGDQGAATVPPASDDFASFESFETLPEPTAASTPEPSPASASPATPASTPATSATPASTPSSAPPSAPAPSDGSIDALFGQRDVGQSDASAASALAQAFGSGGEEPPPISGRPARTAAGELSLDSVFKDGGARPPRSAQTFSFDQFFSESAAADAPAEPGPAATPSQGTGAQSQPAERSADDIEQFNSWLQGLKQR
jgi:tetratricopeptide (TPR) repeat protein